MKKTYIKPVMTEECININCILNLQSGGKASQNGITSAGSRRLRFEEDEEFDEPSLDEFFSSWE